MWLKETNGSIEKFPYSLKDLRKEYPFTSFPEKMDPAQLRAYDVYVVSIDPAQPDFNADTEEVYLDDPVKDNGGAYIRSFKVRPIPTKELERREEASKKKMDREADEELEGVLREVILDYVLEDKPIPQEIKKYAKDLKARPKGTSLPTKPGKVK